VITDPWYHFAGHNVESLDRKPTSFLNWLRRMIKTHRTDPAFRGRTLRILPVENRRVLAFVREHGGRSILCVNNLSRFVQPAEIDLSAWRGLVPVEVIGGVAFPPIGERPYLFTLGPHAFLWCRLESR
jgi:maltose alpha-D-glucosyltransferase/alpha-amylase